MLLSVDITVETDEWANSKNHGNYQLAELVSTVQNTINRHLRFWEKLGESKREQHITVGPRSTKLGEQMLISSNRFILATIRRKLCVCLLHRTHFHADDDAGYQSRPAQPRAAEEEV
jgi:hypothetical protein